MGERRRRAIGAAGRQVSAQHWLAGSETIASTSVMKQFDLPEHLAGSDARTFIVPVECAKAGRSRKGTAHFCKWRDSNATASAAADGADRMRPTPARQHERRPTHCVSSMPIVTVELVADPDRPLEPGLTQRLADSIGGILNSPSGQTWIRLRSYRRDEYAENNAPVAAAELPVFVFSPTQTACWRSTPLRDRHTYACRRTGYRTAFFLRSHQSTRPPADRSDVVRRRAR